MARYIQLIEHLTQAELEQRYRQAQGGVERSHWQMLWLLSSGKRVPKVAAVRGYCQDWVRKLVRRYNAVGQAAVSDKRRGHAGRPRLLSVQQEAELKTELQAAAHRTRHGTACRQQPG